MIHQPLVSIALCVYNGEKYLKEQLDSIFHQTYPYIEVIAVDDCSSDQSRAILETYATAYPNLKLCFNEYNLGYVKNFEKAISLSKGDYIALSDQDDIWLSEKIAEQVAAIGDHVLIYHDSEFVDEAGKSLNKKMSDLIHLYHGGSPLPFVLMNCVSGHTLMFKRALIEHALPFDPSFFHDWWLSFVALNIGTIKVIPLSLVKYRQHTSSTIDFLELKEAEVVIKKPASELWLKKEWIGHCSIIQGPYSAYLKEIYSLIRPGITFFNKIRLYRRLAIYKDLFFVINKTPEKYNLKTIRKMVFTLK